jgi:hypothetical protein
VAKYLCIKSNYDSVRCRVFREEEVYNLSPADIERLKDPKVDHFKYFKPISEEPVSRAPTVSTADEIVALKEKLAALEAENAVLKGGTPTVQEQGPAGQAQPEAAAAPAAPAPEAETVQVPAPPGAPAAPAAGRARSGRARAASTR